MRETRIASRTKLRRRDLEEEPDQELSAEADESDTDSTKARLGPANAGPFFVSVAHADDGGGDYPDARARALRDASTSVYTEEHLRCVADVVVRVLRQKELVPGLRMTYEPETLRFFQARFEPLGLFLAKAVPTTTTRTTEAMS